MRRDHHGWHSPSLGKPMEFLWFGHYGRPLLIFPTAAARYYEHEDFLMIRALADKIEGGEIQVCCVDSVNLESWHNSSAHPGWRVRRHDQYDSYLSRELVPYIQHRAERSDLITYGASFGAFHAMNFALRHPDLVSRVVAFSGVYDIHNMLDGYWDDLCYFHCPNAYVPNFPDELAARVRERVGIVIATGEHDHLAGANKEFAWILHQRGIPAHVEIWEGQFGHDWPWWREHLRRFVP